VVDALLFDVGGVVVQIDFADPAPARGRDPLT
jgi:hypothetical protein